MKNEEQYLATEGNGEGQFHWLVILLKSFLMVAGTGAVVIFGVWGLVTFARLFDEPVRGIIFFSPAFISLWALAYSTMMRKSRKAR